MSDYSHESVRVNSALDEQKLKETAFGMCSGCGLVDWRDENCYYCLDCKDLCLCSFCYRQNRWQSSSHHSSHAFDILLSEAHRVAEPVTSIGMCRLGLDFIPASVYFDGSRLVVCPNVLPPSPLRHWRQFKVGDLVDVKDIYQKWYEATILAVNEVEDTVLVSYSGWSNKWNESIPTSADRFAPRGTLSYANTKQPVVVPKLSAVVSPHALPRRQCLRILDGHHDFEHLNDVIVQSRGQAYAFDRNQAGIWTIDEDAMLELWETVPNWKQSTNISTTSPLCLASQLVNSIPVTSQNSSSLEIWLNQAAALLKKTGESFRFNPSADSANLFVAVLSLVGRLLQCLANMNFQSTVMSLLPTIISLRSYLLACISQPVLFQSLTEPILDALVSEIEMWFPSWTDRLSFITRMYDDQSSSARRHLASISEQYTTFSCRSGSRALTCDTIQSADQSSVDVALNMIQRITSACADTSSGSTPTWSVIATYVDDVFIQLLSDFQRVHVDSKTSDASREREENLVDSVRWSTAAIIRVVTAVLQHCLNQLISSSPHSLSGAVDLFHRFLPYLKLAVDLSADSSCCLSEFEPLLTTSMRIMHDVANSRVQSSSDVVSLRDLMGVMLSTRHLTCRVYYEQPRTMLTPLARRVLTELFKEFATGKSSDGTQMMSVDDYLRFHVAGSVGSNSQAPALISPPTGPSLVTEEPSPPISFQVRMTSADSEIPVTYASYQSQSLSQLLRGINPSADSRQEPQTSLPSPPHSSPPSIVAAPQLLSPVTSVTPVPKETEDFVRARLTFETLLDKQAKRTGMDRSKLVGIPLSSFIMHSLDMATECPRQLLQQIRAIQATYTFSTINPSIVSDKHLDTLLSDVKTAYSAALNVLYPAPIITHQLRPSTDQSSLTGGYEQLIHRLLESQQHWDHSELHDDNIEFLDQFVFGDIHSDVRDTSREREVDLALASVSLQEESKHDLSVPDHDEMKMSASDLDQPDHMKTESEHHQPHAQLNADAGRLIEIPAVALGALFTRCLNEMGGGEAKKLIDQWPLARTAEKAYAAALIKHHGYAELAVSFSSSITILELLRLSSRTRCLSHVNCPEWLKSVVQSTWNEARSPLLSLLRIVDEHTDDRLLVVTGETAFVSVTKPRHELTAERIDHLNSIARSAGSLAADARSRLEGLHIEYNSLQQLSNQMSEPSNVTADRAAQFTQASVRIQEQISQQQLQLAAASQDLSRNISLMDDALQTLREQTDESPEAIRLEHARVVSKAMDDATKLAEQIKNNSLFLLHDIDSVTSTPLTQHSIHSPLQTSQPSTGSPPASYSGSDRTSSVGNRRASPDSRLAKRRRRHSLLSIQPNQSHDLAVMSDEVMRSPSFDQMSQSSPGNRSLLGDEWDEQSQSNDLEMMRSFTTRDNGRSSSPPQQEVSLWSDWASLQSRSFRLKPFDASWINLLVHQSSTDQLRNLVQPAIQRFHLLSRIRMNLMGEVSQLIDGQSASARSLTAVPQSVPNPSATDDILHCIIHAVEHSDSTIHLLHVRGLVSGFRTREQGSLMSFYRRIVYLLTQSIEQLEIVDYSKASWMRLHACLHLFNMRFLPSEVDAVVGSGIFAVLSRLLTRMHSIIRPDEYSQSLPLSGVVIRPVVLDQPAPNSSSKRRRSVAFHRTSSTIQSPPSAPMSNASPPASSTSSAFLVTDSTPIRHLFELTLQTSMYLTMFYLSQLQQRSMQLRSINIHNDVITGHSFSSMDTDRTRQSPDNDAIITSLGSTYLSLLFHQLTDCAAMHGAHPLDNDINIVHLMDVSRIVLHLVRLQPFCSYKQLVQIASHMSSVPPLIQQVLVQIIGIEMLRGSPSQLQDDSAAESDALIDSFLQSLGSLVVKTTAWPAYDIMSKFVSKLVRPLHPNFVHVENRSFMSNDDLDDLEMKEPHIWESTRTFSIAETARMSTSDVDKDPEPWLKGGYHVWNSSAQFRYNEHHDELIETLVETIRSLCHDRHWRRVVLPKLTAHVVASPELIRSLSHVDIFGNSKLDASHPVGLFLASLSVFGGWSFSLRTGAHVEVNISQDFSSSRAGPAVVADHSISPHHTGTVLSIDRATQKVRVQLFQLEALEHPSSSRSLGAESFVDCSFAQLRSIPRVQPPDLNTLNDSVLTSFRQALEATVTLSTHPITISIADSPVIQRQLRNHTLSMILGVQQIQSFLVQSLEAQISLGVRAAGRSHQYAEASLPSPLMTADASLSTGDIGQSMFTLNNVSMSSIETSSFVRPISHSMLLDKPSFVDQRSRASSHPSPQRRFSSSPPPSAVDYSTFLPVILSLANQSFDNRFALTAFDSSNLTHQLAHRLQKLTQLEITRKIELAAVATSLSRTGSRVATRAATRVGSRLASPMMMTRSALVHSTGNRSTVKVPIAAVDQANPPVSNAHLPRFPSDAFSSSTPSPVGSSAMTPVEGPRFIEDPASRCSFYSPTPRLEQLIAIAADRHRALFQHGDDYEADFDLLSEDEDNDESDELVVHLGHRSMQASRSPSTQSPSAAMEDELGVDAVQLLDHISPRSMPQLSEQHPMSVSADSILADRSLPSTPSILDHLAAMTSLGFQDHVARFALARCGGNLEHAIEFIIGGNVAAFLEYHQPELANRLFDQLVDRLAAEREAPARIADRATSPSGIVLTSAPHLVPNQTAHERAAQDAINVNMVPLQSRFFQVATNSERQLLLRGIAALAGGQSAQMDKLQLYDWVDACDNRGEWYIAQIIQCRPNPTAYLVHFFGWSDRFNEIITPQEGRLRPLSLIDATRERLESDRVHQRVKVYGSTLHAWILNASQQHRIDTQSKAQQLALIHCTDAFSFPPSVTVPPTVGRYHDKVDPASAHLIGQPVKITVECIELLQRLLFGGGIFELTGRYCVGDRLMVTDTVSKLCEAEVLEVRGDQELFIHYVGWPSRWDEYIRIDSGRIKTKKSVFGRRGQVRSTHWLSNSGVMSQLISLVGQVGHIVRAATLTSSKDSEMMIEVEVTDSDLGSTITFWTRLGSVKKLEDVEFACYNQSAIIELSLPSLIHTMLDSERVQAAQSAGRLSELIVQSVVHTNNEVQRLNLFESKLTEVIKGLPIVNNCKSFDSNLFASGGHNDSTNGQFAESQVVLPASHLPVSEHLMSRHAAPHHFQAAEVSNSQVANDSTDGIHEIVTPAFDSGSTLSHHRSVDVSSDSQALDDQNDQTTGNAVRIAILTDEQKQTDLERRAEWLGQRVHRPLVNAERKDRLNSLSNLAELALQTSPHDGSRCISDRAITAIKAEVTQTFDRLLNPFVDAEACGDLAQFSLPDVLSELSINQLKYGDCIKLSIDHPAVDSIMVSFVRSSQPSYAVNFYQCVEQTDILDNAASSVFSQPMSDAKVVAVPAEIIQSDIGNQSDMSSAELGEVELEDEDSAFSPMSIQPVSVLPPQLVTIASLSLLKLNGAPIVCPNPCWIELGTTLHSKEIEVEVSDDDLLVAIVPHSMRISESTAFIVELVLYLHRELRVRHSIVSPALQGILIECLTRLSQFLQAFHMSSPWPSRVKATCFELISHCIIECFKAADRSVSASLPLPSFNWMKPFALEAKERYELEHEFWPLYSSYLQRCSEMLTAAAYVDAFRATSSLTTEQSVCQRVHYGCLTSSTSAPNSSISDPDLVSDPSISLLSFLRNRFSHPIKWITDFICHSDDFIFAAGQPFVAGCVCARCCAICDSSNTSSTSNDSLLAISFDSSFWSALLDISPRIMPFMHRLRLFDELLNSTATADRWMPEFVFCMSSDREMLSHSANSPRDVANASTIAQLIKQLAATLPAHFRSKLGDITFKAKFKGTVNRGAEGLPGPFRQVLSEVCEELTDTSKHSLLIRCPNFEHDTGLNRNSLLLNPGHAASADHAYYIGQLMGICLRSQQVLNLDLAPLVWKQIVDDPLMDEDLAALDYSAWRQLKFIDSNSQPIGQDDFDVIYEDLTWCVVASDGFSRIELLPGGASKRVMFSQRYDYARLALQARLHESERLMNSLRAGLFTVVSRSAFALLTWNELQRRICGDSDIDMELLQSRTVYAPRHYNADSPFVRQFWSVLHSFTSSERARFLQFCLARSRLPPVSSREGDWRMKVNILDSASPRDLPSAETCFFNLNLPHYPTEKILHDKLHMAIMHCSSINA